MQKFDLFCKENPALIHGLLFLLGISFIQDNNIVFLAPIFLYSLLLAKKGSYKKITSCLIFFSFACSYGHFHKPSFPKNCSRIEGKALFIPSEIKTGASHIKRKHLVTGFLPKVENSNGIIARNIPCTLSLAKGQTTPSLDGTYYIEGTLEAKEGGFYRFLPDPLRTWEKKTKSFSLVQWRFEAKKKLSTYIQSLFSNPKVADFFIATVLGQNQDWIMKFEFGRLGLQHILSISGFHFGLLAFFLSLPCFLLFPKKLASILMILFLSAYFILLGNAPSILRAYVMLCLYFTGKLLNRPVSAINILGISLLVELILSPSIVLHLGFQLSFLATFSILLLFPLCHKIMFCVFPYREDTTFFSFSSLDKLIYLGCCFLRSSFALNCAVSLTTIPVCLFHFHSFPVMSLVYNLFLPFALSCSLFLFFTAIPFLLFFPSFGSFLITITNSITDFFLGFIFQSPLFLQANLYISSIPLSLLLFFLLLCFSLPFLPIGTFLENLLPCKEKTIC